MKAGQTTSFQDERMNNRFTLRLGDCLTSLKNIPANSIDSIVTDPPYGLSEQRREDVVACLGDWLAGRKHEPKKRGFMGKEWDAWVPGPEVWAECLRVLKPGGHLLAFFSSRTQDIGSVAIRLSGFEVRDTLMWYYTSGFPKSKDVSGAMRDFLSGKECANDSDLGVYQVTAFLRAARERAGMTNKQIDELLGTSGMASHWTTSGSQPAVPSIRQWEVLKGALGFDDSMDAVVATLCAKEKSDTPASGAGRFLSTLGKGKHKPAGPWGTTLKPAYEPIIMARKPVIGSVTGTVRRFGTGALNIEGCRIGERWPANILLDGSEEVESLFGGAARVFFSSKATRNDRDEGLEGFDIKTAAERQGRDDGKVGAGAYAGATGDARNFHPTVKPTALMRHLCKLVTPPGGVVLDPFMGSGSTGKAAMLEGFQFIGCELDPDYMSIAEARIRAVCDDEKMTLEAA
jgi:DNA modification methylase